MNLQELKDIIQRDGGKIIIVENDKPELVVMSFEEYRAKTKERLSPSFAPPLPPPQREDERERSDLTIDDLPLS